MLLDNVRMTLEAMTRELDNMEALVSGARGTQGMILGTMVQIQRSNLQILRELVTELEKL